MRTNLVSTVTIASTLLRVPLSNGFQTQTSHGLRNNISVKLSTKNGNSSETSQKSPAIDFQSRQKCWRPTVSDVERISWGKPAKKKGTGSRGVPHRLNHDDERRQFDQARRKGFLEVGGSGWRKTRRGSPLVNSYRSLCDAKAQVCMILHKGNEGIDELVVDLSPLRLPESFKKLKMETEGFVGLPRRVINNIPVDEETADDLMDNDDMDLIDTSKDAWDTKAIYQLPHYCVAWELPRSEAKEVLKKLAVVFKTCEPKASKSKKPNHVKNGKNRRSGGYGIG